MPKLDKPVYSREEVEKLLSQAIHEERAHLRDLMWEIQMLQQLERYQPKNGWLN